MSADLAIVSSWELLPNLLLNKLAVGLILANGRQSILAVLKNIWNDHWLSDSATTEQTERGALLEMSCSRLERVLILLLSLSGSKEGLDIWVLNHEVKCIGAGTLELDRTWRLVAVKIAPLFAHLLEAFEHSTVKLNKGLSNNWLILALSAFNTHHGWKWAASGDPFVRVMLVQVLDTGHVARFLLHHEEGSVLTNSIAVLRVEVTWKSASTLISEVVTLWSENTLVGAGCFTLLELTHNSKDEQSLSIDLGDLNVTVWVPVKEQLTRDGFWQCLEKLLVLL